MEVNCLKVLLVHDGYFPTGSAFASRLTNIARLLKYSGYSVHVIAAYTKDKSIETHRTYNIDGITYQITDSKNRGSIDTFIGPKNFYKSVKEYIKNNKLDFVITSRGLTYFVKLVEECHRNNVCCIVEQCEWLDISAFKFKKCDPRYLMMNYLFSHGYQKADGILAISRMLEDYYTKLGLNTIRIPTIVEFDNLCVRTHGRSDKKRKIIFTGNLGNHKELLKPIFEAFSRNPQLMECFQFDIYGADKKQVISNVGSAELVDFAVNTTMHGMVDQTTMNEIQSQADFQFFMRPNRRSSNAGFPTKLGESMSAGTPVITNNTGDICCYVKNGVNGIIVNDSIELENALINIMNMSDEQIVQMRTNAYQTARQSFNYVSYKEEIIEFLNKVRLSKRK